METVSTTPVPVSTKTLSGKWHARGNRPAPTYRHGLEPRAAGRAARAAAAWAAAAPWGGYSHGELERPGGPGPGHGDRDSGV